jgi:hypothetical protein
LLRSIMSRTSSSEGCTLTDAVEFAMAVRIRSSGSGKHCGSMALE